MATKVFVRAFGNFLRRRKKKPPAPSPRAPPPPAPKPASPKRTTTKKPTRPRRTVKIPSGPGGTVTFYNGDRKKILRRGMSLEFYHKNPRGAFPWIDECIFADYDFYHFICNSPTRGGHEMFSPAFIKTAWSSYRLGVDGRWGRIPDLPSRQLQITPFAKAEDSENLDQFDANQVDAAADAGAGDQDASDDVESAGQDFMMQLDQSMAQEQFAPQMALPMQQADKFSQLQLAELVALVLLIVALWSCIGWLLCKANKKTQRGSGYKGVSLAESDSDVALPIHS